MILKALLGKTALKYYLSAANVDSWWGNWKQWKQKLEIEMENGNSQNLMQMDVRVKPLPPLKTTSVQRPRQFKDHIIIDNR